MSLLQHQVNYTCPFVQSLIRIPLTFIFQKKKNYKIVHKYFQQVTNLDKIIINCNQNELQVFEY